MNQTYAVSSTEVSKLYGLAYTLYCHQKYSEAYPIFRVLVDLAPQEAKYCKALAACLQMQKDYESALEHYQNAIILKTNQPDPYLFVYMADCQFALGQVPVALQTLSSAEKLAKKLGEKRIAQHVALMRSLWKKQNNSRQ